MPLSVARMSAAGGAEVGGVDPRSPLTAGVAAALDAALTEYGVLLFRERPLTARQLTAFARVFGPIQPHVQRKYQHPEVPDVVIMTNRNPDGSFDEAGARRGAIENPRDGWHSDLSYDPVPAKATLLHAIDIPSTGGNTCFTNVTLAYHALAPDLKLRLNGLMAEFRYGGHQRNPSARVAAQALDAKARQQASARHPVVNAHRVTGRPGIYANPLLASAIVGMAQEEAEALLEPLFDAIDRPEFRWEHEWRLGDTLVWDNRGGVMHSGRLDYPLHEARRFIRTTVRGATLIPFTYRP
ncbi:MAG: hypothetical protein GKR94_32315 [Gammaproteobacteria bacterium]|nr:hypothetical protein [Gammaproteobacteria bacterium]